MERVVFIIEGSEQQIPCLLNPDSLLLQRRAGVSARSASGGIVSGSDLADDPLFFTGGGSTELTLNLLFDVNISGSEISHSDVRYLTGPIWELTENQSRVDGGRARPAVARLVWGKAFNYPGVITDISQRLEYFTAEGIPQRAFVRLKMSRVTEHSDDMTGGALAPPPLPEDLNEEIPILTDETYVHSVLGAVLAELDTLAESTASNAERIDQLAYDYYGDALQWRLIAWINDIDDPAFLEAGSMIKLPSLGDVVV